MADFTMGETAGAPEDDAARQARLAAMQRAMNPSAPVGPLGPNSPGATTTAPAAPQSPDAQDRNAAPAPPTGPGGIAGPVAPSGPINQTDVMNRALTGGSIGSIQTPDASSRNSASGVTGAAPSYSGPTSDQSAAIASAIAAANAANAARNKPQVQTTTTTPQPQTTTTGTTTTAKDTSDPFAYLRKNAADSAAYTAAHPNGAGTDATTGTTTGAGSGTTDTTNSTGGGSGDLGSLTGSIVNQIQSLGQSLTAPGTSSDVSAMYIRSAQGIIDMLNQQEASLRSDYEKSGTQMDPQTQFTLDQLKSTLEKNLTGVKEDLNRRGLYDSGIELQLENNLQKGSASDAANILGQRMSKLQDQLNTGLSQIRTQKVSTASQYGLAGLNAQNTSDENMNKLGADREQAALSAMLGMRGQMNTANTAALGEQAAMQRAALSEQGANSRNAASLANASSIARGNNQNALQLEAMRRAAAASSGSVPTQINNPYGGSTKTGANTDPNLTNNAIAAVAQYPNRAAATASLDANADALTARGVDVQALSDAIDAKFPESQEALNGQRRVGGPI